MGYQKGKGLGKDQQGRVNIVEASKQRGRRGLGMHLQAFEPSDIQWDSEKERVSNIAKRIEYSTIDFRNSLKIFVFILIYFV